MFTKPPLVSIVMGSDSDLPVMKKAMEACREFGVECEMRVISAHRNPGEAHEYALNAHLRGIKAIIAGAGGAAHLAGVIAASTPLPVIAVPIMTKSLGGLDSLLAMVQMPPGIPVATVAIDGGRNAGLLAIEILAVADAELQGRFLEFKKKLTEESRKKNDNPEFTPLYEP